MSGLTGATYRTKLVHMENNIQKARDVLAKWRDGMTPKAWALSPMREDGDWTVWSGQGSVATVHGWEGDAQTIVGTAGNPELLDAIYSMLGAAGSSDLGAAFTLYAECIAAAIIAADERMSA